MVHFNFQKANPLMIINAITGKDLPIYGEGLNIRDWLFVRDHCEAIQTVIDKGAPGKPTILEVIMKLLILIL